MKRTMRRIVAFFMMLLLVININTFDSKAASVSVSVSAGTINVGDSVSFTISVSGSEISSYTLYVSYSSILQYSSGSGSAMVNNVDGSVRISGISAGSVTLTFTATGSGTASVSTSGEAYDIEGNVVDMSYGAASVTVNDSTSTTESNTTESNTTEDSDDNTTEKTTERTTEKTTEKTTEDNTTEEEEEEKSSNCNLASLQVSEGQLNPEFSYSVTTYDMKVGEDVTSINISAVPEDPNASVSVTGADSIKPGDNRIDIVVTAENGASKVYSINVVAGDLLSDVTITVDSVDYGIVNSDTNIQPMDGFKKTTVKYEDWDILAYKSDNGKLTVVCLQDSSGERDWFVYDEENKTFAPYVEFVANANRYVVVDLPKNVEIPEGFTETTVIINQNRVAAYQSDSLGDDKLYLVYAVNLEKEQGFYIYDSVEKTFMRYVQPVAVDSTPEKATDTEPTKTNIIREKSERFLSGNMLFYVLYIFGGLALIFMIVTIVLACKVKKYKDEVEDADEMIAQLSKTRGTVKASVYDELDDEPVFEKPKKDPETIIKESASENTFNEDIEDAVQEALEEATEEAVEVSEEVSEEISEEISEEASKEVSSDISEEVSEEITKEPTVQISEVKEEEAEKEQTEEKQTKEEQVKEEQVKEVELPSLDDMTGEVHVEKIPSIDINFDYNYEEQAKKIKEKLNDDYNADMDSAFSDQDM